MDFDLGTPVYTEDDVHVGNVDRIVVDQSGSPVRALVVHKGFFFSRDILVPVASVGSVDDLGVHLALSQADLARLPEFVEDHYATFPADIPSPISTMGGVMYPLGTEPGVAPMIVEDVKNLPPGAEDIARGATVVCADGVEAGTVRDVEVDGVHGTLAALIIEQVAQDDAGNEEDLGLLRVPASIIGHVADDVVTLTVSSTELLAGSS